MKSKSIKHKRIIIIYAGLLIGLVYAGFPFLWMFFSSLKTNTEIFSLPPKLLPEIFTLKAYQAVFSSPMKVRFFLNSYLVATVVTLLTLLVAIIAGYSFSRYSFKFKKPLSLFIISTQTVPLITLLIPYFGLVVAFKMYDTYFALIFTYMVFTLPYAILMMTGYFNTLPKELDEAVMVDGGSTFYTLWRVLVPLSVPGIIATGVYTFL
ncbi:MAG: carbohydrate ABC transporter permease, partial [Dehalococcoidia bacterium]